MATWVRLVVKNAHSQHKHFMYLNGIWQSVFKKLDTENICIIMRLEYVNKYVYHSSFPIFLPVGHGLPNSSCFVSRISLHFLVLWRKSKLHFYLSFLHFIFDTHTWASCILPRFGNVRCDICLYRDPCNPEHPYFLKRMTWMLGSNTWLQELGFTEESA